MAQTTKKLWTVVTPLIISACLSVSAHHFMMRRFTKVDHIVKMDKYCPLPWAGVQPYQRPYLGGYAMPLEQFLCVLVRFFDVVLSPDAKHSAPFIHDFLTSLMAPVAVTYFEASRTDRPLLLAFPTVVGFLYQSFGGGVILSLYWGLFLVATAGQSVIGTKIDQASAEAVLFGIGMGCALPTLAMVYYPTYEIIAAWQAFPLWISVFQNIHLLFRPRHSHAESGYRTVQATYILIFLVSTVVHIRGLATYNFDRQVIMDAFFPTIAEPSAKGATALSSFIHLLQWDYLYVFGSSLLPSVWFARNISHGFLLVTWCAIASVLLGPGAAVAGFFLWRESNLEAKREKAASAIKSSKAT